MKAQLVVTVITLLTAVSACANETLATADMNKKLIGSWNCQYNGVENGSQISIRTEDTYTLNGRSKSSGFIKVRLAPEAPEMVYSLAGNANWKVSQGFLLTTITDLKIVNVSHPEFDRIMNLQAMIPENRSDTSRILELTASRLSLKIASVGRIYNCNKSLPAANPF